jgi:Predicted membrane protein (DUF2207).
MRKPGTIVPRYDPPQSLTPAAIRYAVVNGTDGKTIAAMLADLVCKGAIKITRSGDGFEVKRTGAAVPSDLPHEEQILLDLVFAYGDPNVIAPADAKRMDGMVSGAEGALLKQYQGAFNTGHYNQIAIAVVLSIVWALASVRGGQQMFVALWSTCFTLVLLAVLWARALPAWRDLLQGRVHDGALFTTVFVMPLPLVMAGVRLFRDVARAASRRCFCSARHGCDQRGWRFAPAGPNPARPEGARRNRRISPVPAAGGAGPSRSPG